MYDCIIIGGGIAGLMAGQQLVQSGKDAIILDKGRGIGGRLATRRVAGPDNATIRFDYGAQYFTARNHEFLKLVDYWNKNNIITTWSNSFPKFSGGQTENKKNYIGTTGIREIAKSLAANLNTQTGIRVNSIDFQNGNWLVGTESDKEYRGQTLVMTPPVPQSLSLLETVDYKFPSDEISKLKQLYYHPCFALLVVLNGASRIPEAGGIVGNDETIRWMADNHKKGISPAGTGVTIHATASFTKDNFECAPESVAEKLLHAASNWLGASVVSWQLHRWRYSQPANPMNDACFQLTAPAPLILAGDIFTRGRVESAALSGLFAAERLIQLL